MSLKLRDLIRNVRACKTAAEERDVIQKECALCRTHIKEQSADSKYRHRNVAKLLFMHMLGYPTHFAQMEALKLVASVRFSDKRLGYLALMILLDENTEVLMLCHNSLKNDMANPNPYVVGLALSALGNISSTDMARDLSNEVEKFFRNQNPYLRKKAALCAIRCIRKVPDLVDDYMAPVTALLSDSNHPVLLTAMSLMLEIMKLQPSAKKKFRKLVPQLVRLLKNLVVAGYVAEYDVVGITDPFLQSKIIHMLRVLGTGDAEASDQMNDILAQVAINTEPTKNPGNAILYECVQAIMSIEAEAGLRVLAINILGRFLLNRDNNIRYVALNTLCKVVSKDTQAIQRHRNTIVDCLKDADVSIRKRALDLIYALVTPNNVRALIKELLNYLSLTSGDAEFKTDLTEKICMVADKFAPSKRWHIDSLINVLATAGSLTTDNVAADLVLLISQTKSLHAYAVYQLHTALTKVEDQTVQLPLVHVGVWCIGEYGELLITEEGAQTATEASSNIDPEEDAPVTRFTPVSGSTIVNLLERLSKCLSATVVTKEYILSALIKLTSRLPEDQERIKKFLAQYKNSQHLELQQRSIEYQALTGPNMDDIRTGVVRRMPVPKKREEEHKAQGGDGGETKEEESESEEEEEVQPKPRSRAVEKTSETPKGGGGMFDLDGLFAPQTSQPALVASVSGGGGGSLDILEGLFGNSGSNTSRGGPVTIHAQPPPSASSVSLDLDHMFGGSGLTPSQPVASSSQIEYPSEVVWQGHGITITFGFTRDKNTPHILTTTARFTAQSQVTDFDFQVAVPKYLKLTMKPASSSALSPGYPASQVFVLENSAHGQKRNLVRVKLVFTVDGQSVDETIQIDKFP